jgi:cytochrome b561
MRFLDSRQGYGWISIGLHWIVALLTFILFYDGLGLGDEGEEGGGLGRIVGREGGEVARQFGDRVGNVGDDLARAGSQFAQNLFAPRALHISLGMVALVLVVSRIVWRLAQGAPPKGNDLRALNILAAIVQWGLLVMLLVLVITGPLLVWDMRQPIAVFNWISIPSPLALQPVLRRFIGPAHTLAAYLLVPFVALHILGALKHAVIDHDGVLRRIFVPSRA